MTNVILLKALNVFELPIYMKKAAQGSEEIPHVFNSWLLQA